MKKAFVTQERSPCFSTCNLLPAADSKSDYVEITWSAGLPQLAKEELCADG